MKCTIKDLADALNLSRNTVSKALRISPEVSPKTRNRVLEKARELNYPGLPHTNPVLADERNNCGSILFLTRTYASDSEFWISVLRGIETILSAKNYHLIMGIMSENDLKNLTFPASIHDPNIKGIIIVEICDVAVCNALLKFNLPIVTVDLPKAPDELIGKIDIITMENKINLQRIVNHLIEKGATRFAYAGDLYSPNSGRGFQERYDALCDCLKDANLKLDLECSLTQETNEDFRNFSYIITKVQNILSLPDVFICGNDLTAIQLMYALQFLGYKIPKDVSIVGFDNIPESERVVPALTTINTPKEYLGIAAARQIIERINYPHTPCIYAQYATTPVIRDSTLK